MSLARPTFMIVLDVLCLSLSPPLLPPHRHRWQARLWMQVMRELRSGRKNLKKVEDSRGCAMPNVSYELTPYEALMKDIKDKKYQLKQVTVSKNSALRLCAGSSRDAVGGNDVIHWARLVVRDTVDTHCIVSVRSCVHNVLMTSHVGRPLVYHASTHQVCVLMTRIHTAMSFLGFPRPGLVGEFPPCFVTIVYLALSWECVVSVWQPTLCD